MGWVWYIQVMEDRHKMDNQVAGGEGQSLETANNLIHQIDDNQSDSGILHSLEEPKKIRFNMKQLGVWLGVFVVAFGVGVGAFWVTNMGPLSKSQKSGYVTNVKDKNINKKNGKYKTGQVIGVNDPVFKDTTEGLLEVNADPTKPGTHKLIRGDESQTVYLTSSVLDLDKFVGMKIKVWGETQTAREVGWFMDVGKIQILD